MLLDKPVAFTKSLRFRLTLLYSLILFIFTASFVLAINVYLNRYLRQDFELPNRPRYLAAVQENPILEFSEEQRKRIREIRLEDLRQIQRLSSLSLIPISLLSFAIGYYISGQFLYRLQYLQKRLAALDDKALGATVDIIEEDEIGQVAESFNRMSVRLKRSFDLQKQFVQDASHELRTPLAIVQTNLDSALHEGATKAEMQEAMEQALTGMKRVTKLTENLLDLTLPDQLQKKETNLNQLVTEQVSALQGFATLSKVELATDITSRQIKRAADPLMLGRAISNLIENAIKYSKDVARPLVVVSLRQDQAKAVITVKDNGPGIPADLHDKIFERFYRVDKSRSRAGGGFGLGLSIARKIVEEHEGELGFVSSSEGSEFWIRL
jgi:signal transduction histidine kinase